MEKGYVAGEDNISPDDSSVSDDSSDPSDVAVDVDSVQSFDESSQERKSVDAIAREVIAGHWGRGKVRYQRLTDAGYDADAVMETVAQIFNSRP